uniref:Uncharacterized protein n=1 Tax=Castor canadensis TaxID=51338 RepID=A0A8C0W135_CASCN
MAQKSQSNFQSTQPGASNSTHAETQGTVPTTFSPEAHSQDRPPPLHDLLDFAWAFLVIASITSFCLFVGLISTIFFTSAKLPVLDFFLFICSIMTGFFSYLNYVSFWSILASQAVWT